MHESIAAVTLLWVPSLCVVRADYKLARQFPPELFNTGTELEQAEIYALQISDLIDLGLSFQQVKENLSITILSYSIFI